MSESLLVDWDTPPNPHYPLWNRSNTADIFTGVSDPLVATWFVHSTSEAIRQVRADFGAEADIVLHDAPIGNLTGIFAGRVCFNTALPAALMSLIDPAIGEAALQQVAAHTRGHERYIVRSSPERRQALAGRLRELRSNIECTVRRRGEELMAERRTARNDSELGPRDAWARFMQVTEETIEYLALHLHMTLAGGEWQARLGGLLTAHGLDPHLVIALSSALGEVESARPALALQALASRTRDRQAVRRVLENDGPAVVLAMLSTPCSEEWTQFATDLSGFLVDYGYRAQDELAFTVPDWQEQPAFVLSQLRALLAAPPAAETCGKNVDRRELLEAQIRGKLPESVRGTFDGTLREAQRFARLREFSKSVLVLTARRARRPYLAIGREVTAAGLLNNPADLRFCVFEELGSIVTGAEPGGLADVVAIRKKQYEHAKTVTLPDDFEGTPTVRTTSGRSRRTRIDGIGVSGGSATGRARVVNDARSDMDVVIEPGEILIAPYTDTAWTPFFLTAAAVVVENGGVLSHAGIVAREFGIPCVAMAKDATRAIGDGDTVTVDGSTGTVTIEFAETPIHS